MFNIEPIIYKQALIGSLTWFVTYFFIRRFLNPYFWEGNRLDWEFKDGLYGTVAMFFMILMNFVFFKFYEVDNKEYKKVKKTFTN
jgi:hypothetical protein